MEATGRSAEHPETTEALEMRPEAGFAHVAVLAFVAARTVPGFGFGVSLVGGTAIAHATERLGGRRGLAAGAAAAIESVAILGPARMSAPGGQLLTGPLIGHLAAAGRGRALQVAATAVVRALFNVLLTWAFIAIFAGGLDNYTGTYDATFGRIPGAPDGEAAALGGTALALLIWAIGASWVQVLVFERADRRWSTEGGIDLDRAIEEAAQAPPVALPAPPPPARRRFDPRAVIAAAAVAFGLLLASTDPVLLAAVSGWLAIAWLAAPAEREVVVPGLILAATLALGAFVANTLGGDGAVAGLEHAARGALLVLTATWMRGAAGTDGVRAVAQRLLARLARRRRSRHAAELSRALDSLSGDRRMGEAIRALIADIRAAEDDLFLMLDAAIDWVAAEAARFRPGPPAPAPTLTYRPLDLLVVVGALLPFAALAG
jgi:hypothetical protein